MTPQFNSSGVFGGPERRHLDRRGHERSGPDRRKRNRRRRARTALIAAVMSAAPAARPMIALLPVGTVVKPMVDVTAEYTVVPAKEAYEAIIQEAAKLYEIDPGLIRAVMQAESAFHPYIVSRAGAEGLMQLMPDLADEMGVTDSFDPRDNIMGGARYLKQLLDQHNGNIALTLASYNAGPGNVKRYGGVPPFKETRNYVKTIKGILKRDRNGD
jgi:soluble lytic murein transglycosylase-like protein